MPRLAANLSLLFAGLPLTDRVLAAADAGFAAVEMQFPYDQDVDALAAALQRTGLPLVLHNLPAGDWAGGERGIACHPGRVAEFRAGVQRAIEVAQALGTPRLNALAGLLPHDVSPRDAQATLVDNLRFAADALAHHGLQLVVEPINTFDVPGFYLATSAHALQVIEQVAHPNLRLQFDCYHLHRMEPPLLATLQRALPHIGHVQIADHPGRHEPGSGEIDFAAVFALLDAAGYRGWVGCEYLPAGDTAAGMAWRRRFCASG